MDQPVPTKAPPEFWRRMSAHQDRVYQFMALAGQELPNYPLIPSWPVRKLRAQLILEEALETIAALGVTIVVPAGETHEALNKRLKFEESASSPDLVGIVDGCADVSVVTQGTLLACGIPDKQVLRVVDESNLRKFGPGGYRDENGKWIKPPNFRPPDLEGVIDELKMVLRTIHPG